MNYYDEIKKELIDNEINRKVKSYSINKSDLNTYYNVGKMLSEAGKHYGENIIGDYANKLRIELNKKYNARTLRRYRQFYKFVTNLKWSAMPTKLSWSHITELMTLSDEDEINYYISLVNDRNISYRKLSELIKDNEYSRIDENTKNSVGNQINVLYYNSKDDFAIIVNTKTDDEVIFCRSPQGETFNEIYENMNKESKKYTGSKNFKNVDEFKAPNLTFNEKRE